MKWINADQQVTVNIYDEEHEEYLDKIMTVEEMLDAYTDEGCPTIYANPEQKTGHWIKTPKAVMGEGYMWYCDKEIIAKFPVAWWNSPYKGGRNDKRRSNRFIR